uniref:Uncharacterized protein n=1 Tax=Hyaloperonospora arabidopsidis (strain Emoy2) TaxID=559515 RepID=M4C5L6_HYAAE
MVYRHASIASPLFELQHEGKSKQRVLHKNPAQPQLKARSAIFHDSGDRNEWNRVCTQQQSPR